jgi:hypothetical protein
VPRFRNHRTLAPEPSQPEYTELLRRDAERILLYSCKPLSALTLADLQRFAQSLADGGIAPVSRARTLAAINSLFGFCQRMRHIAMNPATKLALPSYGSQSEPAQEAGVCLPSDRLHPKPNLPVGSRGLLSTA